LLLPYTGANGAAGANYERGVLMAADKINAAGGLFHRPLRISYADTHSDLQRGKEGARALVDEGVVAIIGPEDDELAREISGDLNQTGVALLTPSSSSAPASSSAVSLWFRLAPSGEDLGIALARRMKSNGASRVVTVSTTAEYDTSFATGVNERLSASGSPSLASVQINARAADFSDAIHAIVTADPDTIVLAADASTGSRFVNEYSLIVGHADEKWYLSPTLEQQAFVQNSFPDIVEGMIGVAPAVSDNEVQTSTFSNAFEQDWSGSTPTTGAFFYYDALAVFAIAFAGAAEAADSPMPPSGSVRQHLLAASGQSGLVIQWNDLARGITLASQGTGVYYSGLTGVISFDKTGARSAAYTRFWTISQGQISSATP
jgi:branched-chain amino acid transport system substrate-binding protein